MIDDVTTTMETSVEGVPTKGYLPSQIGEVVADRYELLDLLGQGGMGAVYGAYDRVLDELVALKMMQHELNDENRERFRREVKLARRVTDPHVARTFEAGFAGGISFITMEYVDGETLKARLLRKGRLEEDEALPILAAIAKGLAAAHRAGVIHRDVKPSNVLISRSGRILIGDFGVAESVHAVVDRGSGTLAYMAPEQLEGREVTPRSDVFGFGVTAFVTLAGAHPYRAKSIGELREAQRKGPPPIKGVSASLGEVVQRCLMRDPGHRYASAEELAELLDRLADHDAPRRRNELMRRFYELQPKPSVAVLPLANGLGEDRRLIVEGLTLDLVDLLSTSNRLRVLARGEENARFVVSGSVKPGSSPLLAEVSIRIRDRETSQERWNGRFEVRPELGLTLSDEVSRAIADALMSDPCLCPGPRDTDSKAIELYLEGRRAYREVSPSGNERALSLFERALAIAPDDPTISAGYALACVRTWFFTGGGEDQVAKARNAAVSAVERAPDRGEPHLALGAVLAHLAEYPDAVRSFRRAISRAPSLAEAHEWLGRLLVEAGRVDEGMKRLQAAAELDPKSAVPEWERLRVAALMGDWSRYQELLAQRKQDARRSFHYALAPIRHALWKKDPKLVSRLIREFEEEEIQIPRIPEARFYTDEVIEVLSAADPERRLADLAVEDPTFSRRRQVLYRQLECEVSLFVGLNERAEAALSRAVENGLLDLLWLGHCPLLQAIRETAVFREATKTLGRRAHEVYDALWD